MVLLLAMVRLVWGFNSGDLSFEGAFVTLGLGLVGAPTAYMIGRDGLSWFPWKYAGRKLVLTIPLLWGVVTLLFFLIELSPGDVADKFFTPDTPPEVQQLIVAKYGLDQPAWARYLLMLKNLLLFDFGRSMITEEPVWDLVADRLPNTLLLSGVTLAIIFPVGIAIGTTQGINQGKPIDGGLSISSLFLYSMPSFWLALMMQLLLTYWWPILPTSGMEDGTLQYTDPSQYEIFKDRLAHLVLPGIAIGIAHAAGTARYMRSSLLEVIRQDYVRTARAKGLPETTVIGKHAIRNALLPIITLFGLSMPFLFSGSVLVETIFAWPGMGRLIVDHIFQQDTPVIIACFYVFTLIVVAGNLLADILYAVVDPRIKYE